MSDKVRPSRAAPLGPGSVVAGRYRLEALLRRGGMGSVFRAEHLALKAPVAVKLLEPDVASPLNLQRFQREAQAAAALKSPYVVRIHDFGVEDERPFIAMELLDGEPLRERIARLGRLAPDEVFRFLREVLAAMQEAHGAGIVHRDLKPDNVFIVNGDPPYAKVLDFGVAKVKKGTFGEATGVGTQTGMMLGTPYYMSPEQAQAKAIDARADLWSIAVIAFEALLGRRPFQAESLGDLVLAICSSPIPVPSEFGPVPLGFDEWFVRGTQRDPARRFQSAREMAEELELLRSQLTGGRPATLRGLGSRSGFPAGASSAMPPPAGLGAGSMSPGGPSAAPLKDLSLTTGQRSAVTRARSEPVATHGTSVAFVALLALAGLIVAGVVAFVAAGGARAIRRAEPTAQEVGPPLMRAAAPPGVASAFPPAPSASASGGARALGVEPPPR